MNWILVAIAILGVAVVPAQAQAPDSTIPAPSPRLPAVFLMVPPPDTLVSTTAATIDFSGSADSGAILADVTWSNDRGGRGVADGTLSWFAAGIPLQPGFNEITVTARDVAGNTAAVKTSVRYEVGISTTMASAPGSNLATSSLATSSLTSSTLTTASTSTTVTAVRGAPPAPRIDGAVQSLAAPVQGPTGLVAAYAFDEGSGTSVADLTGNGNTGTLSEGVTWTAGGKYGSALVFHGSGFVTVPDSASLHLGSGMTLEAWIYPTAMSTHMSTAVMKERGDRFAYVLYAGSATTRPRFGYLNNSGQEMAINGARGLPLGAWTHVAGTFSGSTLTLYLNGELASIRELPGTIGPSSGPLRIGGNAILGEFFRGRIDEVRVYNRALTQFEIRSDMLLPVRNQPSVLGQWAGPFSAPIVPIHSTLLKTGKVLMWDGLGNGGDVHLWDPTSRTFTPVDNAVDNIFCSGHCPLPDGRVFVAGGHANTHLGLNVANIFDPDTSTWSVAPPMTFARWYPTALVLPDGRVLVTAGESGCSGCNVPTPELYDPDPAGPTWTLLTTADLDLPFYPHMFVLTDGRVLAASATEGVTASFVLDGLAGSSPTWSTVDARILDGGSAVMYRPDKIMKSGTHTDADLPAVPSEATTYVLDMTPGGSTQWQETAPMAFPRGYHNLTVLPNGEVLVTGGGDTTAGAAVEGAILPAEMWSPTTRTWRTLAPGRAPRLYHSMALLLPDASVLVGGGRFFFNNTDPTTQLNYEIYYPPYLFTSTGELAVQPEIASAPASIGYGTTPFAVQLSTSAASIGSAVLIRAGSVTHSFNGGQRYVPLDIVSRVGTTLNVRLSGLADASLAPPGDYMLFVVDTSGVPSVARFVQVAP